MKLNKPIWFSGPFYFVVSWSKSTTSLDAIFYVMC